MNCRYCSEERLLGKSHIIPESFFPIEPDDSRPLKLLSNKEGEFPKKAPIGVYDKTILCNNCERLFNKVDNYAQKLLLEHGEQFTPIQSGTIIAGFELNNYNYDTLKRFFLSILWRASVSTHPFYRRISLGPFETIALDLLKSDKDIASDQFPVVLAKFDHPIGKSVLDPLATKIDGINYNQFYLGGYIAYIKTDKRNIQNEFRELILSPDAPLMVISRDLSSSKEFDLFKRIVKSSARRA